MTATDTNLRLRACPLGTWEIAHALPHPALRPGVIGYRGLRIALDRPRRRLEAPVGAATLFLAFEDHPITVTRVGSKRPPVTLVSVLAGLYTGALLAVHGGRLCGVEVNFAPWMAFTLFGVDQYELSGGPVDPLGLPGNRIRTLTDALAGTPDWAARFELLDLTLRRWARMGPPPSPQAVRAWAELTRTAGTMPVPQLAAEVGWSVRQLENGFREQIGQRPKAAARVLRIQRARRLLVSGERASMVAARCGFYDQAHLCGEFKTMTGCTPRTFTAERARGRGGPPVVDRLPGEVTSLVLAG
ncbi:helix-turn-helix domain-containing protein [Kitasatospora sp. HPMI-4]|uniref:helix-turn-helix domain-containing protein n=1 Tax=Kitasatospora sp. HPMI-4 TaxID=3448443 RepID=UPI003F1C51BD